jgi:hypothetical protein
MQWGEVDNDLTSPKKKHTEEAGLVQAEPTVPKEQPEPIEIPESELKLPNPAPPQNQHSPVENSDQSNPGKAVPELPPAPPLKPAPESPKNGWDL